MFRLILTIVLILLAIAVPIGISIYNRGARARNDKARKDYTQEQGSRYRTAEPKYLPTVSQWWSIAALVLVVVWLAFVCTAIVPPKNEGVMVTFGKADTENTLDSGLHFKMPQTDVKNVDITRQTDIYNDSKREDAGNTRYHEDILVRLGSNSPAWVKVTYAWQPTANAVGCIFTDFRADDPTDKLYEDFVQVVVKAAANKAAGTYNPVSVLAEIANDPDPVTAVAEKNLSPDLDALGVLAMKDLDTRILSGSNCEVDGEAIPLVNSISLEFSYVQFNEDTERDIDNFQQEIQKTINSQQAIKTAENLAAANEKIAASISKEPGVLTSRCLDLIRDGFNPPPAFSCFGPSTAEAVVPVQ